MTSTNGKTAVSAKTLERIRALRLIDDEFMQVCFDRNIPCTELVLRIIMDKPDLRVLSVRTQKLLKSLGGRSVCLDIAATDSEGRKFDIEVQRRDDGARPRRARFIASLMDSAALGEGEDFERLPEIFVIFITERDVLKGGKPLYTIERCIVDETGRPLFGDGSHIIYVNGEMRGSGTELEKLMHDFFCADPDEMYFEALRKIAGYFKNNDEGVGKMSGIMEKFREEDRAEGRAEGKADMILQMLEMGRFSLETIAAVARMSVEEIRKIAESRQGCAP